MPSELPPLDKASELLVFRDGMFTYDSVQAFREEAERQLSAALDENKRLLADCNRKAKALRFAKEVIDDQAERFHKDCRCQLCESLPMAIDEALHPLARAALKEGE